MMIAWWVESQHERGSNSLNRSTVLKALVHQGISCQCTTPTTDLRQIQLQSGACQPFFFTATCRQPHLAVNALHFE